MVITATFKTGCFHRDANMVEWQKEADETDKLLAELQRRGIDPPIGPLFWFDDLEEQGGGSLEEVQANYRNYLTPQGKARAHVLIRKDKRQNAEWWVKIIGSVAAFLTGIIGALIGLLAFLRK
jgi:hypothetical protein